MKVLETVFLTALLLTISTQAIAIDLPLNEKTLIAIKRDLNNEGYDLYPVSGIGSKIGETIVLRVVCLNKKYEKVFVEMTKLDKYSPGNLKIDPQQEKTFKRRVKSESVKNRTYWVAGNEGNKSFTFTLRDQFAHEADYSSGVVFIKTPSGKEYKADIYLDGDNFAEVAFPANFNAPIEELQSGTYTIKPVIESKYIGWSLNLSITVKEDGNVELNKSKFIGNVNNVALKCKEGGYKE
ncbi:hypothetical protein [Desulfobacca acetoxidans]